MQCEYYFRAYLYDKDRKDDVIVCHSDSQNLPYTTICIDYSSRSSFELFYPLQSISFIESIEKLILNTYNIAYPGVLTNIGKRYIHIKVHTFMNLNKPKKENPKIYIDSALLDYDNDRFYISMLWDLY
jgi:hypothetical protein